MPPNQSFEQTHQTVIKFACANLPPAWRAAQLSCWASCVDASQMEMIERVSMTIHYNDDGNPSKP